MSTVRLRDFSRNFGEEEGTVLRQVGEKGGGAGGRYHRGELDAG